MGEEDHVNSEIQRWRPKDRTSGGCEGGPEQNRGPLPAIEIMDCGFEVKLRIARVRRKPLYWDGLNQCDALCGLLNSR